jgi:hypothetical protein
MNTVNHTLFVVLILAVAIPGFGQDTNTTKTEKKTSETKSETRPDGLRKITTRSPQDLDFDIHIDKEALEANIERAVARALQSVEGTLERLEINIEPVEINMRDLNMNVTPILVNLPKLNIDIEPIEVELPDIDIEAHMNHHDFDRDDDDNAYNNDRENSGGGNNAYSDEDEDDVKVLRKHDSRHDKDMDKEKDHVKDKSDKKEKEKSKGLKKLN